MSKALIHARSSARRWGGTSEDYIAIHEKIDSTKSAHSQETHRCHFHTAFGIYIIEEIFLRADDHQLRRPRGLRPRHCRTTRPGGPGAHSEPERLAAGNAGAAVDGGARKLPIRIVE